MNTATQLNSTVHAIMTWQVIFWQLPEQRTIAPVESGWHAHLDLQAPCCDMSNHDVGEMNVPEHTQDAVSEPKHANTGSPQMLPQVLLLYLTLHFPLKEGSNASRFEVFARYEPSNTADTDNAQPSSAAMHTDTTDWTWLGTAATCRFRAVSLQLPFNMDKVHFAVRPADVLGKLVPFKDAACAAIHRP